MDKHKHSQLSTLLWFHAKPSYLKSSFFFVLVSDGMKLNDLRMHVCVLEKL